MSRQPPRNPDLIRERRAAVRELVTVAGLTDWKIAATLGVAERTILRDRQAMNLPPAVPRTRKGVRRGSKQPHGTEGRYSYGCRCPACTRAHALYHRLYLHRLGRFKTFRVTCHTCNRIHFVADLLDYECPTTERNETTDENPDHPGP